MYTRRHPGHIPDDIKKHRLNKASNVSITMGRTFNEKSIGWNRTKTIPNEKTKQKEIEK